MITFRGHRTRYGCTVVVDTGEPEMEYSLPLKRDLREISRGFDWGKDSPEALQLSLALMSSVFGPDVALKRYKRFHKEVVKKLPVTTWEFTGEYVQDWLIEKHDQT